MSTLSGIIDAHAGGLFTPIPPCSHPPILPCLVWFIHRFVFHCLRSHFVHPRHQLPWFLSSSVSRTASLFTIHLVFIRHPFPASPGSLSELTLLIICLKSNHFHFFSRSGVWHEEVASLCQKWDQSDECGSEMVSDLFVCVCWFGPKHGSTHTTTRGMMGNGWRGRLKRRETVERKDKGG